MTASTEAVRILEMAHSPFCIPITRALEACGIGVDREEIPNWDRRRVAEVTDGKYCQVPVLIHSESVVFESGPNTQDVAAYVDKVFANGRLFPASAAGLQDIVIAYLENDVELVTFQLVDPPYLDELDPIDRALVIRHKERKFGPGCVDAWRRNRDQMLAEAEAHFLRFERMLEQRTWLLGDEPVYVDFLLFGILSNFLFKGWNQIPASCPKLADFHQRLSRFTFN
jgi:glutathione S-transferase